MTSTATARLLERLLMKAHPGSDLGLRAGCCSSQSFAVAVSVPFCRSNPPHPRHTLFPMHFAVRRCRSPYRAPRRRDTEATMAPHARRDTHGRMHDGTQLVEREATQHRDDPVVAAHGVKPQGP